MADRDDTLHTDLVSGLRFSNMMADTTRAEVFETAVTVLALLDELTGRGVVAPEAIEGRIPAEKEKDVKRTDGYLKVRMEATVNKYTIGGLPDIDCAALMHLCRGRCCTLHFFLTEQDLNERVVKWNYLQPYVIRQDATSGYCAHNNPTTHFCNVYEHRPAVCRRYDCRNDKRIWVDFEKKIPAVNPSLEPRFVPLPHGDPPK